MLKGYLSIATAPLHGEPRSVLNHEVSPGGNRNCACSDRLSGLAAEFGVVMLIYLRNALNQRLAAGQVLRRELITEAIREGAVLRVRPKAMTVAVILAGLLPIMFGHGAGSEVMQRIAAPMVGGKRLMMEGLALTGAWTDKEKGLLSAADAAHQPASQPARQPGGQAENGMP